MIWCAVVLFLLYPPSQTTAEEWPVGARSLGMGATYVALANTADAIFLNLGGLSQLSGVEISLFYQKPFGISELNFGTAAISFPIQNHRVGLGFLTFGNSLFREQMFSLGYSRSFQNKLHYGLGLRYHSIQIDGYGASGTLSLELGLVAPLTPEVSLGFAAKNINRPTIGEADQHLPQTFASGFSARPLKNLTLNFEIFKDVRFASETRFGCEFKPFEHFALRTGVANHPNRFSAGFGIVIRRVAFDYAFFTHNDLGLTHQSSISIHFGQRSDQPPADSKPVVAISANETEPDEITKSNTAQTTPVNMVNINLADLDELKMLPGIGESLARAILKFREEHGHFQKIDDLLNVPGIGKGKLEAIRPFIIIENERE